MEMAACITLTDIQGMAPDMMIIMVMANGAAVVAVRGLGRVLAQGGAPVVMVAALVPAHAWAVVEAVAHRAAAAAREAPVVLGAVVVLAVVARVVMVAPVVAAIDNFAKAAFFKV